MGARFLRSQAELAALLTSVKRMRRHCLWAKAMGYSKAPRAKWASSRSTPESPESDSRFRGRGELI